MYVHWNLTDQSILAQADQPALLIDPDLYLRPDNDLIDCDKKPEYTDAGSDTLVAPKVSISYKWIHTI